MLPLTTNKKNFKCILNVNIYYYDDIYLDGDDKNENQFIDICTHQSKIQK